MWRFNIVIRYKEKIYINISMEKLNDLYENYQQNTNNNELKNKIINYLNKNIKLVNEEEIKLTESIENLADTFNTVLINISAMLRREYKNDIKLSLYHTFMETVIEKKKKEPISLFLIHIYKNDEFRENILKKNDDFFLNDDDKYDKLIKGDLNKMKKLFEFKDYWGQMNEKLKEYIRNSCVTLINISEVYIKEKSDLNVINEIKTLQHS